MSTVVCPNCGAFVDYLEDISGWCQSCSRKPRKPVPLVVERRCKHCGIRYRIQVKGKSRPRSWGACPKCTSESRRRVRLGLPRLPSGGRCARCQKEFEFSKDGRERLYCPVCLPFFYKQRASKAGATSWRKVRKPRRADGSFGTHGAAQRTRDPETGRWT